MSMFRKLKIERDANGQRHIVIHTTVGLSICALIGAVHALHDA